MQTVVGLYRSIDEANKAKQALLNEGYSGGDITVIDQSESGYGNDANESYQTAGVGSGAYATGTGVGSRDYTGGIGTTAGSGVSGVTGSNASITDPALDRRDGYSGTDSLGEYGEGVGAKIKHFFQNLAGQDEDTHRAYTEGVSRGGALVAVNVRDGEEERAAGMLRQFGASEIEGDNNPGFGSNAGTLNTNNSADTRRTDFDTTGRNAGEQVIPVVEEQLQVGKRQVQRGGVRVYSHVVSQPVRENVNLHEERVVVDRHAVNRPATDADFRDAGPIEVRAMGEEAVVAKTGRVVEEVVVGKTATDRTETVEDSVRRTEVEVEQVATGNETNRSNLTNTNDPNTGNRY